MKRIVFLLFFIFNVFNAHATINLIGFAGAGAGIGGSSVTTSLNPINSTGATLIVFHVSRNTESCTIGDNKGNIFTLIQSVTSGTMVSEIYYCIPPAGNTGINHYFTYQACVPPGATPSIDISIWSATNISSPVDEQNSASLSVAISGQPGSITPTVNNELVITAVNAGTSTSAPTISAGYSVSSSISFTASRHVASGMAYSIQTLATATNPTWTYGSSTISAQNIVSFRALSSNNSNFFQLLK